MRWEERLFELFDDLEGQASALYDVERGAELADRSHAEYHHVALAGRLVASLGSPVALEVAGVGRVEGELRRTGDGWCLLSGHRQDWIVRTARIHVVHGASERSVPEVAWSPLQRLGVGSALRRLAESGARCVLHLADGAQHEGVVRRVGQDFVEVESPAGTRLLVAFDGIAAVQSR
ncbi:hypothetical protein [Nocardioides sp. Soil805]|uniref:hypothetical protein n=1 Tax=Nocardioides sp. Soil805 TaxID=1736416 RepID=UPI00070241C6|nr:hypothetical protein [Nocardioides sp. Soil805]KRF30233.1 hypothetical protein ASG94_19675 [Nocardioides sp. Soil805]